MNEHLHSTQFVTSALLGEFQIYPEKRFCYSLRNNQLSFKIGYIWNSPYLTLKFTFMLTNKFLREKKSFISLFYYKFCITENCSKKYKLNTFFPFKNSLSSLSWIIIIKVMKGKSGLKIRKRQLQLHLRQEIEKYNNTILTGYYL